MNVSSDTVCEDSLAVDGIDRRRYLLPMMCTACACRPVAGTASTEPLLRRISVTECRVTGLDDLRGAPGRGMAGYGHRSTESAMMPGPHNAPPRCVAGAPGTLIRHRPHRASVSAIATIALAALA